ncbi:hypothetical protein GBAR_LOCUS22765, partial [Geodia barretti]
DRPGLGEDPLYAVPEQVAARLRAKKAVSSSATQSTHGEIPESVEPVLLEALGAWQKAESMRDSDITLARNNYSRAATLLTKVLLDPAVDPTLKQNISSKRQEALTKCSAMETLINRSKRCSKCSFQYPYTYSALYTDIESRKLYALDTCWAPELCTLV